MTNAPPPLVPSECDLRDFAFMPLDVRRLLTSETWLLGSAEEKVAAVALWCESWHQVPAGSLPDNDRMLAHLSQAGARWPKVKAHVLRSWKKCSDGRLYHAVVAEKAVESWEKKQLQRRRSKAGNEARWGKSKETDALADPHGPILGSGEPAGGTSQEDAVGSAGRTDQGLPLAVPEAVLKGLPEASLNDPKGQGQGEGEDKKEDFLSYPSPPQASARRRTKLSYPDEFKRFWMAYPADPNMSKPKALAAWVTLSEEDQALAAAMVPAFREYCRKNPDYRPVHAVRYLSERRFEGFANAAQSAAPVSPPGLRLAANPFDDPNNWTTYLRSWKGGNWPGTWGPQPNEPGCRIPPAFVAAFERQAQGVAA